MCKLVNSNHFNFNTTRGQAGFGSTNSLTVVKKEIDTTRRNEIGMENRLAVKFGERLTQQQQQQALQLLKEFEDVIAINFLDIRQSATGFVHEIRTGNHSPIKQAPYRLNPDHRQWVKDECKRLLEGGIIADS